MGLAHAAVAPSRHTRREDTNREIEETNRRVEDVEHRTDEIRHESGELEHRTGKFKERVSRTKRTTIDHLPLRRVPPRTINVHGQIHAAEVANQRHLNVSVERTDYAPVGGTWVLDRVRRANT